MATGFAKVAKSEKIKYFLIGIVGFLGVGAQSSNCVGDKSVESYAIRSKSGAD